MTDLPEDPFVVVELQQTIATMSLEMVVLERALQLAIKDRSPVAAGPLPNGDSWALWLFQEVNDNSSDNIGIFLSSEGTRLATSHDVQSLIAISNLGEQEVGPWVANFLQSPIVIPEG